jgi:hypothetical protein
MTSSNNATFETMKSSRNSIYEKVLAETNKLTSKSSSSSDERFWKPTVDAANNGTAQIRFLPAPQGEDLPFVRVFTHGFKGETTGVWYIENSLTTINQNDPVSEFNTTLWNRGDDAGKDQARKQKRRLGYITNVYVVKDPGNPKNEGKVFLHKFGAKIFEMLIRQMHPEFDDETPVNPFDLWEGTTFRMKIRDVAGWRNYDSSTFMQPSPLLKDDDELERVWKSQHSLTQFVTPDNFKSYDELKTKLYQVLAILPPEAAYSAPPPVQPAAAAPVANTIKDADDSLDFFKRLADDA